MDGLGRVDAMNVMVSDWSSRKNAAQPRKGADERGGPGNCMGPETASMRREYADLQKAKSEWRCMPESQKQRAKVTTTASVSSSRPNSRVPQKMM